MLLAVVSAIPGADNLLDRLEGETEAGRQSGSKLSSDRKIEAPSNKESGTYPSLHQNTIALWCLDSQHDD